MLVPKLRFNEFSNEWKLYNLKEILIIKNGLNKEKEFFGQGTPIINYMDINKNTIITSKKVQGKVTLSQKEISNFSVKKGDIFFTRTSETSEEIGLASSLVEDIDNCVFSGFILKATPINDTIFAVNFPGYYFRTDKLRKEIIKHSSITTRALTSGTLLYSMNISIPNKQEQTKIANTLELLDKKIELQIEKIEALKLYKKGLSNKVFKSIDGEEKKLSEILNKWNIKNKENEFEYVESVSNKYGFIPQSEQFEDRNVASTDKRNYYVIKKNVFAYNPSRLDVGSLALKTDDKVSLVSPLYECFTTSENIQYMLEWFNSSKFKYAIKSRFEGGVRNTLTFTNLATIEITIPEIEQQNKYASVFTTFNKKIKYEEERLLHLVEFKNGIMQNMFV